MKYIILEANGNWNPVVEQHNGVYTVYTEFGKAEWLVEWYDKYPTERKEISEEEYKQLLEKVKEDHSHYEQYLRFKNSEPLQCPRCYKTLKFITGWKKHVSKCDYEN